jgi:hypothetical protein
MARISGPPRSHLYQLVMSDDGQGPARTIELEAVGPEAALYMAERQCKGRELELLQDDRSLGRLKCVAEGGYWILSSGAQPLSGESTHIVSTRRAGR